MAFIHWLSGVGDFPARWHCGTWTPLHGYTHIISDLLIGLSYLAIAGILIATVLRSPKLPLRGFFRFFAAFIKDGGNQRRVDFNLGRHHQDIAGLNVGMAV